MNVAAVDPTFYSGLQSLDMGNVLSMDGRAHPFTGETPVVVNVSNPITDAAKGAASSALATLLPSKQTAIRIAVAVVAVLIVLIVFARFVFAPSSSL